MKACYALADAFFLAIGTQPIFGAIIPALIGALLALSKLYVIHRSPNAVQRFWQSLVKGDAGESKHSRRLRSSCQVLTQEEEKVFFWGKNADGLSMSFAGGQMAGW